MLKKKEYSAILQSVMSKIEVARLFEILVQPKHAIRLVKEEYGDRKHICHFLCDRCQTKFQIAPEHGSYNLSAEECTCPKCGFQIEYGDRYYSNRKCYFVSDSMAQYPHVFDGEGLHEPTLNLFETVATDEKRYRVIRRFYFRHTGERITEVIMHRCLIIPENKQDDYALLYEDTACAISTSRTECPREWYKKYEYGLPNYENFYLAESGEFSRQQSDGQKEFYGESMTMLDGSRKYYSKEAVTIRNVFDLFPVDPIPKRISEGKPYAEDHGNYVVMRSFEVTDNGISERKRWIYSVEQDVDITLVSYYGNWKSYEPAFHEGFTDSDYADVKSVLERSFVGKMGLYLYLNECDDIFNSQSYHAMFYLHTLLAKPIIESLQKVGLSQLISAVAEGKIKPDMHRNTLWQKLGVSRSNFNLTQEAKLTADEFELLREINSFDERVDRETFEKYLAQYKSMGTHHMRSVAEYTGLRFKDMVGYVESAYYTQGLECSETMELWHDYLSMFNRYYQRNVKGAEELYPDSLKKAHDVLVMQTNKWATGHSAVGHSFAEVNEKWKHLEFHDREFEIILPHSAREVVMEGTALHHCVGTYVQRIVDGYCLILFIRRRNCEEKSFFTMEYDLNGRIRQIRGQCNNTIESLGRHLPEMQKSLVRFLLKWGKKNKIDVGYSEEAIAA